MNSFSESLGINMVKEKSAWINRPLLPSSTLKRKGKEECGKGRKGRVAGGEKGRKHKIREKGKERGGEGSSGRREAGSIK